MNILVVGVQHSCTRLFVGLLNKHKELGNVGHWSIPSGNTYHNFANNIGNKKIAEKIVIVVRERNCVDLSNLRTDKKKNVSRDGIKFIKENLDQIKQKNKLNDVIFVSFEMLEQYKEYTLRQVFRNLGINENNYNYNNDNETFSTDWFKIGLKVKDVNEKYILKQ